MTDSKRRGKALREILLEGLSAAELALLRADTPATEPSDYDAALAKLERRLSVLHDQVSRNEELVRSRYAKLEEEPEGRRRTLFENSPPSMLLALAYDLMKQSFAERFANVGRSLQLATLAVDAVKALARRDLLSPEGVADLQAEAHGYLGNARRLNSDLAGAERAFDRAEEYRLQGTRDRELRTDLLRHLAYLRVDQGSSADAGKLMDREIAIRRLIGDEEKLGEALINRGIVSPWFEPLERACEFLAAGVSLVTDPRTQLLALFPLGEALARKGKGFQAWKVACQTDTALILTGADELGVRNRAIKGIALRAAGELVDAERELTAAYDEYSEQGRELQAAIAALDLACVCAAQGRIEKVRRLATEARAVFEREKVGKETLRALLTLQQAAEAERVTEQLAVEVVNFVVRSRQNRSLRFARRSP